PLCTLSEPVPDIRARLDAAGEDACIVVNDAGVVLGRLSREAIERHPRATVEDVMDTAPVTVRPDTLLEDLIEHLRHTKARQVLVTSSDGVLVGPVSLRDAERRLEQVEADARGSA